MNVFNPITWLRWIADFAQSWILAVPWREAPKAVPAIILTIVLFTTGFIAFSDGTGWRNRLLDKQLRISLERDDYATAEIVIRRQLESQPDDVDLVHRFALVRDAQSYTDEATRLMEQLLGSRHLPAAKWLLQNEYIGKQWSDLDEKKRKEFGQVLELIHDSEPKNLPVKKMYAEFLIVEQRLTAAIPLLDELSQYEPMRGLQAAALARQVGDKKAAERYADKTLETVSEMSKDDPTNSQLAMAVARNQIFLRRFSDAVRTLDRSVKLAKTPEEKQMLSQGLGDSIVAWVNYIEETPSNTIKEKLRVLKMLQAALRFAPNNPRVVTLIADQILSSLEETDKELVAVRTALVEGSSPGIAHFINGTTALMKKDFEGAGLHLGLAADMMPRSGAILNNLAVALAMRTPPDYDRALEVSNAAIDQVSEPSAHFFETRGQILFRMEDFRKAIPDLERALSEPSLAKKAHEMLADCYQEVGDDTLSKMHQEKAKEEENKKSKEG